MVHVAVDILAYAFGEGGGGHQTAYAVYAFINVDNCERPLMNTEDVPEPISTCNLNHVVLMKFIDANLPRNGKTSCNL